VEDEKIGTWSAYREMGNLCILPGNPGRKSVNSERELR
jgi:hypothetical protein